MKRGARLAVLLAALAVLIGAWVLAQTLSGRRETALAEHAHEEPMSLAVGPAEEVNALSWNYFGDAVNLKKDGDAWVNAEDEACPIDSDAVAPLVEAVATTSAAGVIEDVTDFDQYGLADPAFAVMAATADRVMTYYIGDSNPAGVWYVRLEGEDKVYLENGTLAGSFQVGLDDVLALESIDVKPEDVTALAVRSQAGDYSLTKENDPASIWYTDAFPWFFRDGAGAALWPLDTAKVQIFAGALTDLALTECVSWDADDEADYGLDAPQAEAELYCGENVPAVTVQFGAYDDGDVYARLGGSALVYKVPGTVLDGFLYPDTEAMRPLNPLALNWDALTGVTLTLPEETYDVTKTMSAQEGEEPESIYTEGGRSLDPEKVSSWLDQAAALPADSRTAPTEGREELFRITFRQDNELYPEVTAVFSGYDSVHRLCTVNGEEYYLVSRVAADAVASNAEAFFKAKEE